MQLGERVRELRTRQGLNQKQLAEKAGITQATISRIENGLVNQLKSEALKRLAVALSTTVDYLIGKTAKPTPDEVIAADKKAEYIFRGYEKLSASGRRQLEDFVRFLETKEKREQSKK